MVVVSSMTAINNRPAKIYKVIFTMLLAHHRDA
jgi:hypothetical protein